MQATNFPLFLAQLLDVDRGWHHLFVHSACFIVHRGEWPYSLVPRTIKRLANLGLVLFFKQLNTVLILLALRQFLHLKRTHQQARSAYDSASELVNSDHPLQFGCINKMCKFNFIFRSTYFNINLLVCTLPAFAVYWTFSVLALEQMHTSAFQFIFALLNFLFSCCLLLLNLPYVRIQLLCLVHCMAGNLRVFAAGS